MKTFGKIAVVALMVLSACAPKTPKVAGIEYAYMDTTVRPGDDFARYAAGNWGKFNPQPLEYPMWGTVSKVSDENIKALAGLIKEIASADNKKGSIEQKIGDLYNMMMDSTRLNNEGAAPLKPYLDRIEGFTTREEVLAYCTERHSPVFFSLSTGADEKDSGNNIVCIGQGGLSLGNRDYYLSEEPQTVAVREAMKQHLCNLFKLAGFSEEASADKVQRIWALESEIAVPSYSQEQLRDPEGNYHKISVDSLTSICNGFDWKKYLADYRYDKTAEVDLGQPAPVAKACDILMNAPVEDLKAMLESRIISGAASILSDDFSDENFDFSHKVFGVQQKSPRWKNAESLVDDLMSDAVGQMYVKKYFPKEAKEEMLELIGNLRSALAERIKAQTWMSDTTKTIALEKLAAYGVKVGYPDKWDDLSKLVIDPTLSLYENVRNASDFYWNLHYEKTYNKPVDRTEWGMSPQTVNAYYDPTNNEICFPAGFLQPPLFNLAADAAANYGSIGVVIGHEMTHGFDDQGRQYTKDGNLKDWWTAADAEAFAIPCQQMVDYFNSLWVIPGELKANGAVCLGENIADHGGLNVAYDAFQMWQKKHGRLGDDNGFTPEQRFFLSYANVWAGTASNEILRYLTMMDVHSVDKLRVNGGLAQCDYWYDAFNIQPGDSLYVAPENRVKIW